MTKLSIMVKGAMKDLDYVYDFIKDMQKTKELGKKLEKELDKSKVDIELAKGLIKEMNGYLQAANIARGKVKDVLAILANVVQQLERRKENVTILLLNELKESLEKLTDFLDNKIVLERVGKKMIDIAKKYGYKLGSYGLSDEIIFLNFEKDGIKVHVNLSRDYGNVILQFDDVFGIDEETFPNKQEYESKILELFENRLRKINDFFFKSKIQENFNLDKIIDNIILKFRKKGIQLDRNTLKQYIRKDIKKESGCEKIDEKINDDGLKVELVKCGDKYYIFINEDNRDGPFDSEIEARDYFDDY